MRESIKIRVDWRDQLFDLIALLHSLTVCFDLIAITVITLFGCKIIEFVHSSQYSNDHDYRYADKDPFYRF